MNCLKTVSLLGSAAVLLGLAACVSTDPWVADTLQGSNEQFRGDFELVEVKCSQCHSMKKLRKMYSRDTSRDDWVLEVEDMQARDGSRIRKSEIQRIADLLHQWSQGAPAEQPETSTGNGHGGW